MLLSKFVSLNKCYIDSCSVLAKGVSIEFILQVYHWHLTVADLSKTWVVQNLDNMVTKYIRQWLDLSISATFSTLVLKKSKYGINLILPSTKFTQCQTVIRNALKTSPQCYVGSD